MRFLLPLITLTFLLVACEKKEKLPTIKDGPIYPGAEWAIASPEKYKFSPNTKNELDAYLEISRNRVTGLVVIVGGEMIYSHGQINELSYLASARKSIMSMLYGKYVGNGTINLDRTIGNLISTGIIPEDVGGLMPIEKEATIRHCLAARSGVYHLGSNTGDDRAHFPTRGTKEPGTYFMYNNWDFNVNGSIFEGLTKMNIYDAFGVDFAVPLRFQDWDRGKQVKGGSTSISLYRAYHFYLSARDMARLGYLMLRNGMWNDTQIIPKDWVIESTSAITPLNEMNPTSRRNGTHGYGYMWWVRDGNTNTGALRGSYLASGMGGQLIAVVPELDMVVAQKRDANVHTSSYSDSYFLGFINLLASLKD